MNTAEIRIIKAAMDLINPHSFTIPSRKKQKQMSTNMYGAFASGVNVYLNAHSDRKFTYSSVIIHMKKAYTVKQKIVAYFVFPRLGISVPLRPGDVLFFNPQEEHMVSSRCDNRDDIYCVSLYLKSDNMGLNYNSIELKPKENNYLGNTELHN